MRLSSDGHDKPETKATRVDTCGFFSFSLKWCITIPRTWLKPFGTTRQTICHKHAESPQ